MPTPTSRTLTALRADGYVACVIERRLPHCPVTVDAFGIIDVAAVRPGELLLVQCTSGANHAARALVTLAAPVLPLLLSVPGVSVEIWSWRLSGPRNRRKTWQCRRQLLTTANVKEGANGT
jgi:hypothetical protein